MSLDRKDLKIQALKERLTQITVDAEDRVADLRVELTVNAQEYQAVIEGLQSRIDELTAQEGTDVSQDDEESPNDRH